MRDSFESEEKFPATQPNIFDQILTSILWDLVEEQDICRLPFLLKKDLNSIYPTEPYNDFLEVVQALKLRHNFPNQYKSEELNLKQWFNSYRHIRTCAYKRVGHRVNQLPTDPKVTNFYFSPRIH